MNAIKTLILGAAGRDFHNFLTLYRDDPKVEVVAFTATQIPYIESRRFPASLAGPRYPEGIPVYPEEEMERLIDELDVQQVVFAYSDVSVSYVGSIAARVNAAGADFVLNGARSMLRGSKPVLSVCAVRTGCGKSQVSRFLVKLLQGLGRKSVALRHPMPYGDLEAQAVQRFATVEDLDKHKCTIEEREEYEPYVTRDHVIYAGVDCASILEQAEAEADVILWDGGNNDLPFVKPDLHIVLVDPHRPGDEIRYVPSEAQLRLADVVLIPKSRTADPANVAAERELIARIVPDATIIETGSRMSLMEGEEASLKGQRVVCVEDGPTTTHGGMAYGAATLLAKRAGAEIVDPRPYLKGELQRALRTNPELGPLVPALGYSDGQLADLKATLDAVPADIVLSGTPIELSALIDLEQPVWRVAYDLEELEGQPSLGKLVEDWLANQ